MKLFKIDYMDDCEDGSILMIAENELEVTGEFESKVYSKLSCPMGYWAEQIDEIDGHKIIVH